MIIGVCGEINSGKNTVADMLVNDYGYTIMALADSLKCYAQQMFDIPDDDLWGPSQNRIPWRKHLQELGTDFGRKFDSDIWVRHLNKRILYWLANGEDLWGRLPYVGPEHDQKNIVISDVRFLNEVKTIREAWGGKVIKVTRPGNYEMVEASKEVQQHESEAGISQIPENLFYANILNDLDLNILEKKVQGVLCTITS